MIRQCSSKDFDSIYEIVNDAAQAYKGIIPADRWKEPYMPKEELRHEIEEGVVFWGCEEEGELIGVMGIQHVQDVTLIRHAYVRTSRQNQGVGGKLLAHLRKQTSRPILIGTWSDATWAIRLIPPYTTIPVTTASARPVHSRSMPRLSCTAPATGTASSSADAANCISQF